MKRLLLVVLLCMPLFSFAQQHVLFKDSTTIDSFRLTMWVRQLKPPMVPKVNPFFDSLGSVYLNPSTLTWYVHKGAGQTWTAMSGGGGTVTSITASAPLTGGTITTSGTIGIQQSSSIQSGFLSSVDWNTFNNKVSNIKLYSVVDSVAGLIPDVSGYATQVALDDTSSNLRAAFASDLADSMGVVRDSLAAIRGAIPSVTGFATQQALEDTAADHLALINGKQPTGNYITALTGDITASGPGSAAATLATVNSNVGLFGSATVIPRVTVNAKGLVTAVTTVTAAPAISSTTGTLALNRGGTGVTVATTVNGTAISYGLTNTITAAAGTLTGSTLNSTVTTSSLTSVGTITSGTWSSTIGSTATATTQAANDNSTKLSTTGYTDAAVAATMQTVSATTATTLTIAANTGVRRIIVTVTAQSGNIHIANPTGTLTEGTSILFEMAATGSSTPSITYGSMWTSSTNFTMPTIFTASKVIKVLFMYTNIQNGTTSANKLICSSRTDTY